MIFPISVIIPTLNRPESILRTIKTIYEGKAKPSEIIIIDQTEDEEIRIKLQERLRGFDTSDININYIYSDIKSLTASRNIGLKRAKNKIIICSDDDVDVRNDTLENVFKLMQNPTIAMIGAIDSVTVDSGNSNFSYLIGTKSYFKRFQGHVTKAVLGRYPVSVKGEVATEWAMGYFFVVRKELCDKWNLKWDENLKGYAYAEDLDFSYSYFKHAKREGLKCILSSEVIVKHLASLEYRIPKTLNFYKYVINREYIRKKHSMGFGSLLACLWCNLFIMVSGFRNKQVIRGMMLGCIHSLMYSRKIKKGDLSFENKLNFK